MSFISLNSDDSRDTFTGPEQDAQDVVIHECVNSSLERSSKVAQPDQNTDLEERHSHPGTGLMTMIESQGHAPLFAQTTGASVMTSHQERKLPSKTGAEIDPAQIPWRLTQISNPTRAIMAQLASSAGWSSPLGIGQDGAVEGIKIPLQEKASKGTVARGFYNIFHYDNMRELSLEGWRLAPIEPVLYWDFTKSDNVSGKLKDDFRKLWMEKTTDLFQGADIPDMDAFRNALSKGLKISQILPCDIVLDDTKRHSVCILDEEGDVIGAHYAAWNDKVLTPGWFWAQNEEIARRLTLMAIKAARERKGCVVMDANYAVDRISREAQWCFEWFAVNDAGWRTRLLTFLMKAASKIGQKDRKALLKKHHPAL